MEKTVCESLERYRTMALDLGMDDAKVITSAEVLIDERVRLKCMYPRCANYGFCANCPPFTPEPEQMRSSIAKYEYGIFLMHLFRAEEVLPKALPESANKGKSTQRLMYDVILKIESAAFADGFELAVGFANGSCKRLFCPNHECAVLRHEPCRAPLKSRSSMEGCSMRAMQMARNAGWKILPAGKNSTLEEAPYLMALGLVMIV